VAIKGFVADLDGTLVDNIPFHMEAFGLFVERHGLPPLDEVKRARIDGKRNSDVFPIVFDRPLSADEVTRYADEKEQLYRHLSRGRLVPRPGLLRLLDRADALGLPVAVATSAPLENVRHTLAELGLAARLTRIARSDDFGRGKPFPDVFLGAARLIGVAPSDCVAFEDAPSGIMAARAAAMTCVAVGSTHTPEMLAEHGALPEHMVADFEEYLNGPGRWMI
jgi:HAD superfamily hydrolase (TIGR01509 family)